MMSLKNSFTFPRLVVVMALGLCVWVCVFSFIHSIDKPLTLDETEIASRSHILIKEGPLSEKLRQKGGNGFLHPPLYDYTLALIFIVFGVGDIPARGFGVFCFLLTGILMLLILRELLKQDSIVFKGPAMATTAGLYLINPLLIQHSMLIDADTTGTALFLVLFAYIFVRFEVRHTESVFRIGPFVGSRILLALVFALMFLCKELMPFLVFGCLALYRVLQREWKKLGLEICFILGLGSVLAGGAWFTYCFFTGTDMVHFLRVQIGFRYSRMGQYEFILKVLRSLNHIGRWPLYWVSTPFWLLVILCVFQRCALFFKTRRVQPLDFCFMTALIIWLPYFFFKPSIDMMKYQHPLYPLLIIAMVYCVYRSLGLGRLHFPLRESGRLLITVIGVAAVTGLAFYYYRLGDYLMYAWDEAYRSRWRDFVWSYPSR